MQEKQEQKAFFKGTTLGRWGWMLRPLLYKAAGRSASSENAGLGTPGGTSDLITQAVQIQVLSDSTGTAPCCPQPFSTSVAVWVYLYMDIGAQTLH